MIAAFKSLQPQRLDPPEKTTPTDNFAPTWDTLATALRIEERTLYDFRQRHAPSIKTLGRTLTRADGRHDITAWRAFADSLSELQGRGLNNPNADHIDERALRLRERQLLVAKAEHKLAVEKGEVLPLTEYQSALRQTVVAFDAALQQIPGRAAEALSVAARIACLAMLASELTPKQFERISKVLEKTPLDHAEITRILTDELEACRRTLAAADFMLPTADTDTAPAECPSQALV
jgi:hypothetical protein